MESIDTEALYRRYGPMVLRRCRRLLRDEDKAVDAMHDVFVELVRASKRLEDRGASSLLYQMATHVCLDRLRRERRRPEDSEDALMMQIAAQGDLEESAAARSVLDRLFGREVASTRTIAVLHLLDGMTLKQVATNVGLSVSGVRKRLRVLRERLEGLEVSA